MGKIRFIKGGKIMKRKIKVSDILSISIPTFYVLMTIFYIIGFSTRETDEPAKLIWFILWIISTILWITSFLLLALFHNKEQTEKRKEFNSPDKLEDYKHVETLEIHKLKNKDKEDNEDGSQW
jgi:uncharacterized membrane protein